MTCPHCLRDVPLLVGPDAVCPDCYLVASEDLIPSLFGGVVDEGEEENSVPDYVEDCLSEIDSGYSPSGGGWPLESDDDFETSGASETPWDGAWPPTFGGRPRF
jgi:hypothetical protein